MPDDDVTLGEVARNVKDVKDVVTDLAKDVHAFRLDVTQLRAEVKENTKDIAELQSDRKADTQKQENRRWLIYLAIFVAVLGFVTQLYFAAKGP